MSSFATHMLIGGVGGLALARGIAVAPHAWVPILHSLHPLALIVGSALLATVPDIDEPNSWIARRARIAISLGGLLMGSVLGVLGRTAVPGAVGALAPWLLILGCALGGLLIGMALGKPLLMTLRHAAGGHRRLTNSLLLAALFATLGGDALAAGFVLGWTGLALAWGIVLHDLGDVVTPSGVPLFYPLSDRTIRVLPAPLAAIGEGIACAVALVLGLLLVWPSVLH